LRKRFSQIRRGPIATIKEVAKEAGVSVSTVSHVINNTRFVSDDLKTRVLTSMEELGYQPNHIARSLRKKETDTIGLIISDITNPFFSEIAWSIEYLTYMEQYSLILCCTNGRVEKETFYINQLSERRVDGIILISPKISTDYLKILEDRDIPVVLVDNESPGNRMDVIMADNFQGGRLAAEHLTKLGHEKIACISGPFVDNPSYERVKGFLAVLKEKGLPMHEEYMRKGNFDVYSGVDRGKELVEMEDPPTAIFACNDMMAMGAIQAVVKHGLRVPDDISVVGFDDISMAEYFVPALTTIRQPMHEIGSEALKAMMESINIPDKSHRKITLDVHLIERDSTKQMKRSG